MVGNDGQVHTDAGGTHGRRVVLADVWQDHHKREHRQDAEGVGCGDGRLYPYIVWAHVDRAVHAFARE